MGYSGRSYMPEAVFSKGNLLGCLAFILIAAFQVSLGLFLYWLGENYILLWWPIFLFSFWCVDRLFDRRKKKRLSADSAGVVTKIVTDPRKRRSM